MLENLLKDACNTLLAHKIKTSVPHWLSFPRRRESILCQHFTGVDSRLRGNDRTGRISKQTFEIIEYFIRKPFANLSSKYVTFTIPALAGMTFPDISATRTIRSFKTYEKVAYHFVIVLTPEKFNRSRYCIDVDGAG